ncbi:TonB-dependent receptor [Bacteroides sp.]|uniref:TonB-dependent receptor domain-containing protein n=1 Tax=Bacteroides sp. TaxID=29523 RepID=UPI002639F674|nr:TonB-dependent receptor [Bacteroides sp.]
MIHRFFLGGVFLSFVPLLAWSQQDTIADQRLNEVVVTAKLPLVEISAGRTTYRMDASIAQSTGSLYDVLSSLPGVMIDSKGDIILNGQSGVKVLMDGKPTYLSGEELVNLLKSTPATNTDKIDLITQPSARHDAAGSSGLIDICTRKIKLRGMNLALNGNLALGRSGNGYGSASMNIRENKFNLYLTYSYFQGKDIIEMFIDRAFNKDDKRMTQDSFRNRKSRSHYFRTGFDYYLNERTIWGTSMSGNLSDHKEKANMITDIQEGEIAGNTNSRTKRDWNNITAGTNILHKLKKEGGELSASFDYFHYSQTENQLMKSFNPDTLKGNMKGNINLYVGQMDAIYPLHKNWKLQIGGKTSFVAIDNRAGYMRPSGSGWLSDGSLGSHFVYGENINALYLQSDYEIERLKLTAGLRLEHTHVHGDFGGNTLQKDSSFTMNYLHLFPTLALQYSLASGNAFQLSYGRRITRPNYGDLNPFTYIFDEYTHEGGNTKLRPSFSNYLELAYVHRDWLQLALFHSYADDVIMKSYQEQENQRIYVSPQNLSSYTQTGVRVNATNLSPVSFWKINLMAIGIYNNYKWIEQGEKMKNCMLAPIFSWMNQFAFSATWSAELSARYNGRMAYAQATVHPILEVNMGIQKKVFHNKGTITIFAKDIFNTNYQKVDVQVLGTRVFLDERHNKRVLGIAFSWRFQKGNEVKENKRKNGIDETKRVNL